MQQLTRTAEKAPQKPATILIVDDQPINLTLLVNILNNANYNTRPALNGHIALGAVKHTPPDLILLDIRMPEMDGIEVCRRLKADPQSCRIPVIFISALDDLDEKVKAFKAGGVDYISRPFHIPEVLARVATHLELAHMRNQMESLVLKRTTALESKTHKLAQEIKTHQATARQLRQSEENYRFLVESQNDLIIKLDGQNKLTFANPNVYKTFGTSADKLIGRQLTQIIETDNRSSVQDALDALANPPYQVTYQGRAKTKQGWRWFEWSAKARLDTNDNVIDVVSVGRDISKIKAAEMELKESKEKFHQLADHINAVFWIFSVDWKKVYYVSPAYERIWGRTCQSLYEAPHSLVESIIPQDRQNVLKILSEKVEGHHQKIIFPKYRIRKPDGKMCWISVRAFPVIDSEGQVYRWAGVAEDITEKVELENQLRQTHKMEAIGTLAGGIAHEINNILGIIIGNTELVLDDTPPDALNQQYLSEIFKASLRGRDVVKKLLNFSRESIIERIPIDLGLNVKESLHLINASLPATIEITSQIDSHIHTVVADATQISQLMINLCNNAAQAMEKNGGKLHIRVKNTLLDRAKAQILGVPSGGYVALSITDTGHGIPEDIQEKIFDPYFTTRKFGNGTGMGLAIVHGIVGAHQGAIETHSLPDQGTRFDIYLPASDHLSTVDDKRPIVVPAGNETILFVDDEASITRVAKALLNRLGYNVCVENNPATALQRFQAEPAAFDLVITDMTMPHLTGDQLAAEVRNIRENTPVIICTGNSDRIDKEKSRAIGIHHFIQKPFERQKIATTIRQVLDDLVVHQKDANLQSHPDQQQSQMTGNR